MPHPVSDSRFYMWRSIFAVAHADDVVTATERAKMQKILNAIRFTEGQREILSQDIEHRQDIIQMFAKITDQRDRSDFFNYARELAWADGNYAQSEQDLILKLKRAHIQMGDFDMMSDESSIELEDVAHKPHYRAPTVVKKGLLARLAAAFREH